jgi:aminoglycoside phosphotransferase family enzyme
MEARTIMQATLPPIVRALLQPQAYPHPADRLQLHETHISWVILAGPFAYKLRKPVNLGFLDFRSVAARIEDCAHEVRLNRRLCPDVYLGVVLIVEQDGGYRVGEALSEQILGQTVCAGEPAVWMRRLPDDGMLPAMLTRNAVTPTLMRQIAQQLAAFHVTAATGPGVDEYGSVSTITDNWTENFMQAGPYIGWTLSWEAFDQIEQFVAQFLAEQHGLLERRIAEGRIREGHGDLHAGSICLEGDRVHLFDCLEFAPRFRCSDVAAEVAFLAMDLDHFGRPDLGAAFVEEYVSASNDHELPALLDFYRCCRAFVRGKVASLRLTDSVLSRADRDAVVTEAQAYFELACGYTGAAPRVTALAGAGGVTT